MIANKLIANYAQLTKLAHVCRASANTGIGRLLLVFSVWN